MRHYAPDSPHAVARVLALTILADGGLDVAELRVLKHFDLKHRCQLDEAGFDHVLRDFCYDLLQFAGRNPLSILELDRDTIGQLLRDIEDPGLQMMLLRVMLDIIDADGTVSTGEAVLLAEAMQVWDLELHHARPENPAERRRGRRFARRGESRAFAGSAIFF